MTVKGPDGEGPGEQIRSAGRPVQFQVVVQSPSWLTAKRLERSSMVKPFATEELRETVTPTGAPLKTDAVSDGKPGRTSTGWCSTPRRAG